MNINHGENAIIKINELPAGAKPVVKSDADLAQATAFGETVEQYMTAIEA